MGIQGNARGDITVEWKSKDTQIDASIKKITAGQRQVKREADGAATSMSRHAETLRSGWVAAGAAMAGIAVAARKIWDSAKRGSAIMDLERQVAAIKGTTEAIAAIQAGARSTIDDEEIAKVALRMGNLRLAAEDLRTVGAYALTKAAQTGEDAEAVLQRVGLAFESGRFTSLRFGAGVRTADDALVRMRAAVEQGAEAIDGSLTVRIKQAEVSMGDLQDRVDVLSARFTGSFIQASDIVNRALQDQLAAFVGREEVLDRVRKKQDEWIISMERERTVLDENGGLSRQITTDGERRYQFLSSMLLLNDKQINTTAELTAEQERLRTAIESGNPAFRTLYEYQLGLLDTGKANVLAWAALNDQIRITQGLASTLQRMLNERAMGAARAVIAAFEAAQRGVDRRGSGRGGGGGDRSREAARIREETIRGARETAEIARAYYASLREAATYNQPSNVPLPLLGMQGGAPPTGGQDPKNFTSAFQDQMTALSGLQSQFATVRDSVSGFAGAFEDMWSAIGDATGSKKALAVLRGFKAASLAILAVEAAFMGGLEFARGLAALSPFSGDIPWVHFAASAAFFAQAAGKGAAIAALYSGGGGKGGGGTAQGQGYQTPPDYARQARNDRAQEITVNIMGPSLDSPEFRRTVTNAVRRGTREGYTTDPSGMV